MSLRRRVEYVGGPLDGEVEAVELARSPGGDRYALPGRLTTPVSDRPDWEHVYALDPSGAAYRYQGYAPSAHG